MLGTWIVPTVLLVAFAALLLAPLLEALLSPVRSARFYCPFLGREVSARFAEPVAYSVAGPPDVLTCSVFEDRAAVTCEKSCLEMEPWRE